jgi:hypothetical protein
MALHWVAGYASSTSRKGCSGGPVSGHEILNGDGQETERWRPRELRDGGHQICLSD